MSDHFYRAFEERYYAPQATIKNLRRQYLPFVQPLVQHYAGESTFDAGCGRGEWLELMSEIGLTPQFVYLYSGMLNACIEKGLNAHQGNAIDHLNSLPDNSQVVVSAFHVVEHITFPDLQVLVQNALRVLKPGGLLIMETPNPENITVATQNFHLDPTHKKPIPPKLLSFLPEHYGFAIVKVIRLQENKVLHHQDIISLNDVLVGASPDYAVIAQKNADAGILSSTQPAFDQEYGLTLNTLVTKFDARLDQHLMEAQQRAHDAQNQTIVTQSKLLELQNQLHQTQLNLENSQHEINDLNTQLEQLNQTKNQWHNDAEQAKQRITDLMNSRSWRISAPLRSITPTLNTLKQGVKNNLKPLLKNSMKFVMNRPVLKEKAMQWMNKNPAYKERLRRFGIHNGLISAPASELMAEPHHFSIAHINQLPARAKSIHAELTHHSKNH